VKATRVLRELINNRDMMIVPGCYDAISAKIVQELNFEAVYLTGFGVEASLLGAPDIGLTSMTELVTHAGNIAGSIDIPLICDGESGFGDVKNTWRMVKEFEKAGVAGIHIEDQVVPKKCGIFADRKVLPLEVAAGKIRAAAEARRDKDFVIIARSDAKHLGLNEVIKRLNAYAEAGADLVMVAEWYTEDEIRQLVKAVEAPWVLIAFLPDPTRKQPTYDHFTIEDFRGLGAKMVVFPLHPVMAAIKAISSLWGELKNQGTIRREWAADNLCTLRDFWQIIGLSDWAEIEKKYVPGGRLEAGK